MEYPNPVKPDSITEKTIDSFVKSTRQEAEAELERGTRGARSWATWVQDGPERSGPTPGRAEPAPETSSVDLSHMSADYLKSIMETVSGTSKMSNKASKPLLKRATLFNSINI